MWASVIFFIPLSYALMVLFEPESRALKSFTAFCLGGLFSAAAIVIDLILSACVKKTPAGTVSCFFYFYGIDFLLPATLALGQYIFLLKASSPQEKRDCCSAALFGFYAVFTTYGAVYKSLNAERLSLWDALAVPFTAVALALSLAAAAEAALARAERGRFDPLFAAALFALAAFPALAALTKTLYYFCFPAWIFILPSAAAFLFAAAYRIIVPRLSPRF